MIGEGVGGGETHLVGNGGGPHVEGAAKDPGETQGVVHLIGEVRAPGRYHRRAGFPSLPGPDFRYRVGTGKHDRILGHSLDPLRKDSSRPRRGKGNDYVGPAQRFFDAALSTLVVGCLAELPLFGEVVAPPFDIVPVASENTTTVDDHRAPRVGAPAEYEPSARNACRTGTDKRNAHVLEALADVPQRADEPGESHRGGALLVVVPYRYLRFPSERLENAEALGLGDVLEVDAPVGGLKQQYRADELIGVFGVEHNRYRVHSAEVLVEERLALHHRQPGLGTDIAEPEDTAAVRDHRDGIPLAGVVVYEIRILGDFVTGTRHPRGVPDGKIREIAHCALGHRLHLATIERV